MSMQATISKALDIKWHLTERVDSLKGSQRPPRGRQAREDLSARGAISSLSNADIKMTVVSESYSPSIAPLQALNKINLRDLHLETHHRGNLLVLRTFGHSTDISQIQTFMPVEDETGDVDRIAIFNFGLSSWPEKRLPSGIVLAIKEPFYSSVSEDIGMALCIHHPSDVIFLEDNHSAFPSSWQLPIKVKTASEWKLEGNEALKKKDFIKANHCYSKGLAVVHDIDIKLDLLRNRSQARLFLGSYEAAKEDAVASTQGTMHHDPKYGKALYRAGRAAYELSDYAFALKMFQRLVDAFPSDQDGPKEIKRTRLRMQEAQNGVFEFEAMAQEIADTADYRTQQASYLRRIDVRPKGLFATENIAAGEIILCEKAFVASNTPKNTPALSVMINPTNNRALHGSHVAIWVEAVRKAFHNPSLGEHILNLHDGSPANPATEPIPLVVDGMPVVDVFRMQNIIEHAALGFTADESRIRKDVQKAFKVDSSGVWPVAARMNHSCLFNASRGFVGDFIIVRASKDILQNEEVTVMFCPADGNFEQLQQNLEGWGICCDCRLCKAEIDFLKGAESRASVMYEVTQFLKAQPLLKVARMLVDGEIPSDLVKEAKRLEKALQKTYPLKLFATCVPNTNKIIELLPTFGMANVHEWLMFAHYRQPPRALDYAHFVLMDHGYKVTIQSSGISLDRTNCVLSMTAVKAMQYIEHFYTQANVKEVAKSARALAEEMHVTYNGSMIGYQGWS
ncbi:hypothetical protein D6C98_08089 [Aureobasidium pullulans]|uniref:SET domain-containing protein n=1 Tax=Aureobasidium pullulans TaxID=5580 RepID=A0A4S9MP50_AURPU|nr:hypothetical protein D6D10_00159 [Aureobasidium pullulans]THY44750.1 hypothetical protein D6C98_08089 [Aureobasidium pullulans]